MKRSTYYYGVPGKKFGIWNDVAKRFQFGICEDTPMLAEARLYKCIGDNAKKYRFQPKMLPDDEIARLGKNHNWISVSDRLPDVDGRFLCMRNDGYVDIYHFAIDGNLIAPCDLAGKKNVWYFYESEYGFVALDYISYVTHWMPIPASAKGGSPE